VIEHLHWHPFAGLLLIFAYIVDFIIADPRCLPHPVVFIGKLINSLEDFLRPLVNTSVGLKIAGIVHTLTTVIIIFFISFSLFKLLQNLSKHGLYLHYISVIIFVYFLSTTIAARGLIDASKSVIDEIKNGNLIVARDKLSMIVGRDTNELTEEEVLKATIETLSENLSDGVVAPVFYYMLGGLPLAMTYKAINTLDSMVGYKNEKYKDFGWASARLDDIANFLPARITALMIVVATFLIKWELKSAKDSMVTMIRDGANHLSPNSGIPESAMAGAVGVRLGGPSFYGGKLVNKPYIGVSTGIDYLTASRDSLSIAKVTILISMPIFFLLISQIQR